MPCHKGMSRCRALCGHRDMVHGYRSARHAALVESESVSRGGWAARDDDDRRRAVTFKDWLKANKTPEEYR
jgi:hypothetical protein